MLIIKIYIFMYETEAETVFLYSFIHSFSPDWLSISIIHILLDFSEISIEYGFWN